MANKVVVTNMLKCDSPWIFFVNNQPNTMCGIGACDPYLRLWVSALEAMLYSTFWMPFTREATVAGDLSIATGTAVKCFQDGVGDIGTAEGTYYALTRESTNMDDNSNPVGSRDIAWFAVGIACHMNMPYQRQSLGIVGAGSPTDPRYSPAFLDERKSYTHRLKDAVSAGTTMRISFSNTGINYELGPVAHWPDLAGGATGGPMTKNAFLCSAGDFMPLVIALLLSSDSQTQKLTMDCTFGHALKISDVTAPTVNVDSAGVLLADAGLVRQGVKVMFIGHLVCYPYSLICGVPTLVELSNIVNQP